MDRFDWLELEGGFDGDAPKEGAVRTRPHDGPSYYRAASQMRRAGHFRAAAAFYEKALGFDERDYPAWVELCDTLLRARQWKAADAKSAEALDAYRRVRSLYAARALVLAHQEKYEEAYRHSDVSLEGEERGWYACCVRAEIVLRQDPEQRSEAIVFLEEAADLAESPESPWEARFLAGWMMLDAKLPALAAGFFAESARYDARAPITWLCLGDCFRDLRLYDQALFYYQRVSELEPAHDLALARQRLCASKTFGLMRLFPRRSLRSRWNRECDKLIQQGEPHADDF